MKNVITENEFFSAKTGYPPEKEDPTLVSYNSTVTMADKTHTTTWTNASRAVRRHNQDC